MGEEIKKQLFKTKRESVKNNGLSSFERTNKNVKEMMDEIRKNSPRTIIFDPKGDFKKTINKYMRK